MSAQVRASALSANWQPSPGRPLYALRRKIARVDRVLARAYGTPDLGNVPDPLDEAVYILLTYQTDIARARQVWTALRTQFPSWQAVLDAPEAALSEVLRPSGFQHARARFVRRLLAAVSNRWGLLSLEPLRLMSDSEAETELRALPGLDIKGARCVLMYSLGRQVFPVDSNAYRFMHRFGVLASSAKYRRNSTHNELQELIPQDLRLTLHVNLVIHGQTTCLPQNPQCSNCPLRRSCNMGRKPRGT